MSFLTGTIFSFGIFSVGIFSNNNALSYHNMAENLTREKSTISNITEISYVYTEEISTI